MKKLRRNRVLVNTSNNWRSIKTLGLLLIYIIAFFLSCGPANEADNTDSLYNQGQYREALSQLKDLDDDKSSILKANIFLKLKDYDNALASLEGPKSKDLLDTVSFLRAKC